MISLDKVTLDKATPSIDLAKGEAFRDIMINLNWSRGVGKKSFFGFGAPKDIDLDVGCLYEMQNGKIGAIQALGNAFGSFDSVPYVHLLGDDRTGSALEGEFIRINGKQWSNIKRVIVYAFIYEGAANWDATDGRVTVMVDQQAPVEVRMTGGADQGLCGVALLENVSGAVRVTRLVEYYRSQRELDRAHNWGLDWGVGRK